MCGRILVVDGDQSMCEWIVAKLRLRGWDSAWHTIRELATLEDMERRYILHVLQAVGGNRGLAAQVLAVDPKTLYRKLRRFGAAWQAEPPPRTSQGGER